MARRFAAHLALPMITAAAALASAAQPATSSSIDLQRGVAVVQVGDDALDATWDLASRAYADPLLRPQHIDDSTARVLAGEQVPSGASARLREFASVRSTLQSVATAANVRLLSSVASDLDVSAILLVHSVGPDQPRASVFLRRSRGFASVELWKQPDSAQRPSWAPALSWLHAQALASREPPAQSSRNAHQSVVASPWFWGALGVAAGAALLVFVVRRDETPDTIHLEGRIGP